MKSMKGLSIVMVASALAACGSVTDSSSVKAQGADATEPAGTIAHYTYTSAVGPYPYIVYVPASYREGTPWPLVVNVHGCGTMAEQQMKATLMNDVADAEHFIVMYPDVNQAMVGDQASCWRAIHGDATSQHRGLGGDADNIAAMTQQTMSRYSIDAERVYLIGMSSGAFQASVMAATYPDLYAAVGVNAGGGYMQNWSCEGQSDDVVPEYASLAYQEMGPRARFMPFFAISGDKDGLGDAPAPGGCTRMAFKQWMATDNLVAASSGTDSVFALDPSATVEGSKPDGYSWTTEVFHDPSGCTIGEHWIVHGMGHNWSGGSDPAGIQDVTGGTFNDPKGPSASQASWNFFRRFTKSGTKLPCVESR